MLKFDPLLHQNLELINKTPVKHFTTLSQTKDTHILMYKYDDPLHSEEVLLKHSRNFSLFDLYNLSSLGIIFSYVFAINSKFVKQFDKYIVIKRPSAKNLEAFTGVELSYQSPFINVYTSQDGASLVSANNLFEVIASSMVRKSSKDNKE